MDPAARPQPSVRRAIGTAESLDTLLERVASVLERVEQSRRTRSSERGTPPSDRAGRVVDELVHRALAAGVPVRVDIQSTRPGSGSTAEAVLQVRATIPLVFKMDEKPKLLDEARVLQRIQQRSDLPVSFRQRFPRVFAVRDQDGYAYVMEEFLESEGYSGSERAFFSNGGSGIALEQDAVRLVNAVCDALFEGYVESVNPRLRPSLYADYVQRIADRLAAAGKRDEDFASLPVLVLAHRREYKPWQQYVDVLSAHREEIEHLAPPFVTFVHGDPNPENVLVAIGQTGINVRFIDVKEWQDGDYLFDMTKLHHYLAVTAPMELIPGAGTATSHRDGDRVVIKHRCEPPSWLDAVEAVLRRRVSQFAAHPDAASHDAEPDLEWESRWQLGMASNLLGLPDNRLAKGRRPAALAMYAEGLTNISMTSVRVGDGSNGFGSNWPALARWS